MFVGIELFWGLPIFLCCQHANSQRATIYSVLLTTILSILLYVILSWRAYIERDRFGFLGGDRCRRFVSRGHKKVGYGQC